MKRVNGSLVTYKLSLNKLLNNHDTVRVGINKDIILIGNAFEHDLNTFRLVSVTVDRIKFNQLFTYLNGIDVDAVKDFKAKFYNIFRTLHYKTTIGIAGNTTDHLWSTMIWLFMLTCWIAKFYKTN